MADLAADTNAIIAFQRGEPSVVSYLSAASALIVPAPVLGELYFGAFNSGRITHNLQQIAKIEESGRFVSPTEHACRLYGEIRSALRRAGKPIPINDLWIAAICVDLGVPLLTRDRHFDDVPGLQVIHW